ncbi:FAD-dependent oxidoreductase [uncultured Brevundimonas sp.]|uniref:FAD-dependent oxidoreductase n=1 Tax=uncultured Brevundimonas sp. TaxID=213418 RepID=UPI00260BC37B|nr:FAD-dependent oxidoreductase [uncultured Brevundimonas sp.]
MTHAMQTSRRTILAGLGGLGASSLAGCVTGAASPVLPASPRFVVPPLAPLRMRADLITRITVCLRPFRAAGPRIEVERIGDKRVVHNYGHGGSGWSLSWGSAEIVREMSMQGGTAEVAVIGCGALGLTSATLLQRAGAKVVVYAAERLPQTRSARATGLWTPDSRIADADRIDAAFPALWERMARASWAMHQTYVGQPAEPVAFLDRYIISDGGPRPAPPAAAASAPAAIRFAEYGDRLHDIVPRSHELAPSQHPFAGRFVRQGVAMQFNIAELGHRLMADFIAEGGRIETRTFNTPADLTTLSEPVIVNCTGYGARALFGDETIVPVRGQMTWLPPQPEVRYGLYYKGMGVVSRPDGVGVQNIGGDMFGYGETDETPDRLEAEKAIARIAALYERAETAA